TVISVNDQFIATNERLRSKLEFTDSIIEGLNQTIDAAKVIGAQALSGSTTPTTRTALATAIDGVRTEPFSAASQQFDGPFLFSGTPTSTEPFVDTPTGVTFQGNDEPLYLRLDQSTVIKTNFTNQDLFAGPPPLFSTLESLKTAIQNNDTAAIQAGMN